MKKVPTRLQVHYLMRVADDSRSFMASPRDQVLKALCKRGLVEQVVLDHPGQARWIVTAAGMAIIAGQTFCPHMGCIASHTFRYQEDATSKRDTQRRRDDEIRVGIAQEDRQLNQEGA